MFKIFRNINVLTNVLLASQLLLVPNMIAGESAMHEFNFNQQPQLKTQKYSEKTSFGSDNFINSSEKRFFGKSC